MFKATARHFLSSHKLCNTRRSYNFLEKNIFMVNGSRVLDWNFLLDYRNDYIILNGKKIENKHFVYIMMNKPAGYVCSSVSDMSPTVYSLLGEDFFQEHQNVFTVGRLDKDTRGLIILTSDGYFSHLMTSPLSNVDKKYKITLAQSVSPAQQYEYEKSCRNGLFVPATAKSPSFVAKPAVLEWLDSGVPELGCGSCGIECCLTISEGKFHQVRRMIEALGNQVLYLKRVAIGNLKLDNSLKPGEWRYLLDDEIKKLVL